MWELEKTGTRDDCQIFGVQIFDFEWKETGQSASVRDPDGDADFVTPVYTVEIGGKIFRFAAGELRDGVYGFYLWSKEERKSKSGKTLKLSHIIMLIVGAMAFAFLMTIIIVLAFGLSLEALIGITT